MAKHDDRLLWAVATAINKAMAMKPGEKKWTNRSLAEATRLSESHIGSIRRGEVMPTFDVALRLFHALHIGLRDLLDAAGYGEMADILLSPSAENLCCPQRETILELCERIQAAVDGPCQAHREDHR